MRHLPMHEEEPSTENQIDVLDEIVRLNQLSEGIERVNPNESLEWAEKANQLAKSVGNMPGEIKSLLQIGRSQWLRGNLHQALKTLLQALEMVKKTEEHKLEVDILNALGNVNSYMLHYAHTLDYYGQALKLADAIGYEQMAAGILNNFGEVYKNLKDYSTALMYYHESLSRHEQIEWKYDESIPMVNIGQIYCEMGDFSAALTYAEKSMEVHKNSQYAVGEGYSQHLFGRIAHRQGRLEEAVKAYMDCLAILPDTSDVNLRIELCIDLYEALRDLGQEQQGLAYLLKGLSIAEKLETDAIVSKFYSMIATHYEKQSNLKLSTYYFKKYHDLHTRMSEAEQQSKLRSIAFQMEADEYIEKHRAYEVLTEQLKSQAVMLEEKTEALAQSKEQLQVISDIGQKITSTLTLSVIFEQIYHHINTLMRADVLGIAVYQPREEALEYPYFIEYGHRIPVLSIPLTSETSWAVWCFKNKKEVFVNDVEIEFDQYVKYNQNSIGELMHSLLFCPLVVNDVPIGIITVQSKDKNTYEKHHLDAMRILASYAAIAINNARQSNELEQLNQQLKNLSEIDGLTSVANRRKFDAFLKEEWQRAVHDKIPLSLLLIDVDFFKEYNDHYGHHLGDQTLKEIARILQYNLKRATDLVGRYGGDEFVVVLHHTHQEGAMVMARQMLEAVCMRKIQHDYSDIFSYVTITIGAATVTPSAEMDSEILLQRADEALYRAKKQGRNSAVHFDE